MVSETSSRTTMMESNNRNSSSCNIAASWPAIVDEQALGDAKILPQLLHEASEEAQAVRVAFDEQQGQDEDTNEQLQSMLDNYRKHVIKQKQQQSAKQGATAGRSASHLQRRINAPQPTPMSHSHPCLFPSAQTTTTNSSNNSSGDAQRMGSAMAQRTTESRHAQHSSDPRNAAVDYARQQYADFNGNGGGQQSENELLRAQIEKFRRKCDRLKELESAYKRIERDYEQMGAQHVRRDELARAAMHKLEQQLQLAQAEGDQLRAQCAKLGTMLASGANSGSTSSGDEQHQQHVHLLLGELNAKNEELLLVQERQCIELEAQSATLEEQRTHIEVLEKALANAQERLAAKERSAVDAVAVVDRCSTMQRMLQEALEDKQRQKEEYGRQVAQLEMELTQLRLQLAKEANAQAIGSIGRKGGGAMAAGHGTGPEAMASDEVLKLRKTLAQKEERISQLEQGMLEMQRRFGDELRQRELAQGSAGGGATRTANGRIAELEALSVRQRMEKAEKERRVQELLDEKHHIQAMWAEERRSLDARVRALEKDLRHFVGSQSSLASSSGGGGAGAFVPGASMLYAPSDQQQQLMMLAAGQSPFSSVRGQKSASYLRHRSTAELPTSARGAADEERIDVMARMEELGRRLAERRAHVRGEKAAAVGVQRSAELGLAHTTALLDQQQHDGTAPQQHTGGMMMMLSSQHASLPSRSSSTDQPAANGVDLSPSFEDQQAASAANSITNDGSTPPQRHTAAQSGPSSTSSSTKKRYYVANNNGASSAHQLNAYLEQLPEATRRRLAGAERAGGFHLLGGMAPASSSSNNGIVVPSASAEEQRRMGVGRRGEGGCRRLIRDHSMDAKRAGGAQQNADNSLQQAPPPAYQETQQHKQQMRAELPPPAYQTHSQLRQMHQMSSIEEPMTEPPPGPPPPPPLMVRSSVVEVVGEDGDSDTLNSHRQLVYRRSSLGNPNLIK